MHEPEELLQRFTSAVYEIQQQYSQGGDVIRNCLAVDQLCEQVDNILHHGLKEGLLSWASNTDVSFWPLAIEVTNKENIEEINRLKLRSERYKCHAWVRLALKENTLGSYIGIITRDVKFLRGFYHPHAFLCDRKKVEPLISSLVYGISTLDFDISLADDMSTGKSHGIAGSVPDHLPSRSLNGFDRLSSSCHEQENSMLMSREKKCREDRGKKKRKKKKKAGVALIADGEEIDGLNSSQRDENLEAAVVSDLQNGCEKGSNDCPRDYVDSDPRRLLGREGEDLANTNAFQLSADYRRSAENSTSSFDQNESIEQLVSEGSARNVDTTSVESRTSSDDMKVTDDESAERQLIGENTLNMSAANLDFESETVSSKSSSVALDDSSLKCTVVDSVARSTPTDCSFGDSTENENSVTERGQGLSESTETDQSLKSTESDQRSKITESAQSSKSTESDHQSSKSTESAQSLRLSESVQSLKSTDLDQSSKFTDSAPEKLANVSCVRKTSASEETRVSLATFECGTPKQIDDPSELVRHGRHSVVNQDDEDYNFVPGIHKEFSEKLSRSSSVGSFAGSGSFSNPRKISDAISSTGPVGSLQKTQSSFLSSPGESWKFVNDFFGSPDRKGSFLERESVVSDGSFSGYDMFDDLLGVEEDHFSPPESFMGVSTTEELEHAIESCKAFVASAPEHSAERSKLVDKLVQLRLKLQELQDASVDQTSNARRVLGHEFVKEDNPSNKVYCDKCGKSIWLWQSLFTCDGCHYSSHRRCLDMIRRPCARKRLSVSTYNTKICQEGGLSTQQYKCVECRKRIAFAKSGDNSEARLCDYSGQFFCEDCHWNDLMVIPARVVHNWDFTPRKVSRQTKQLLNLMVTRPLLNVEELNPALFKFVGELREVKRLREEVLIMKKYFLSCREALESKLLLQLQNRPHFVDSSAMYSLQDLIDVDTGTLLPTITRTHSLFLTHIKTECQLCQAKGFVCEICKVDEIIFAFDPHSVQCPECRTVFHKLCFKAGTCPKCQRRREREQEQKR